MTKYCGLLSFAVLIVVLQLTQGDPSLDHQAADGTDEKGNHDRVTTNQDRDLARHFHPGYRSSHTGNYRNSYRSDHWWSMHQDDTDDGDNQNRVGKGCRRRQLSLTERGARNLKGSKAWTDDATVKTLKGSKALKGANSFTGTNGSKSKSVSCTSEPTAEPSFEPTAAEPTFVPTAEPSVSTDDSSPVPAPVTPTPPPSKIPTFRPTTAAPI